jgi:hypothetical protein
MPRAVMCLSDLAKKYGGTRQGARLQQAPSAEPPGH